MKIVSAIAVLLACVFVTAFWTHRYGQTSSKASGSTLASTTSTSSTVPTSITSQRSQLDNAVSSFLEQRRGTVEIAVQNVISGATWTFGPQNPQDEASVVKVNILATLLATSASTGEPLSVFDRSLAQEMIEQSDNKSATALWDAAGGSVGIGSFDNKIGLSHTTLSPCVVCSSFPWPGWGLSTTTPLDQIALLKDVFIDGAILPPSDREYELKLMESVTPSDRWGVSGGVSVNASVALKNGWLPLDNKDTDWQINSIGWVHGDGRDYLVALLSTGNPSKEYGIQTLDTISTMVWDHFMN